MADKEVRELGEQIKALPIAEKLELASGLAVAGRLQMARSVAQLAVDELDVRLVGEALQARGRR